MIKNLIFDMGDVLIGYRWKEMLTEDFGVPEERAYPIGKALFDDRAENVEAAKKFGMEAVQITSENMLLEILSKFENIRQ
ncbi:MAG: hypothetical protein K6G27_04725 [Lachnospiraceae bacterium]|nr:hypothetical protein [Lachnospiraceae bacterium]